MNMMLRKISLCLLLLGAMAGAFARSDRQRDEQPPERNPQHYEPQRDSGRGRDWQNGRGNQDAGQGAPHGRLSPDERRALRQQINEVGRDLYPPRR